MEFNKHLEKYLSIEEIASLDKSIKEDNLKAVLLNNRKMDKDTFLNLYPEVTPHPIVENAFIYDPKVYQLGKSIHHNLGCFYIQEPSAMVPAYLLQANKDDLVLDLCAAPGGKSIQTSFLMENDGLIISNDLSRSRSLAILENVERLGIKNIVITNNDFSKIYPKYKNTFSKIILDAPCSGSGMFKKDTKMIEDWSYNKVLKFAEIQKDLILMCYEMLKEGGEMIYSTCSFSYEEDEEVVLHLLDNTDAELINIPSNKYFYKNRINEVGIHLLPNIFPGDGQYIAHIKKPGNLVINFKDNFNKNLKKFLSNNLELPTSFTFEHNQNYYALTRNIIDLTNFSIIRAGVKLGEFKGKDFIYDFHYSRSLTNFKNEINITLEELMKYQKGEILTKKINKGFVLVKYNNIPISFGKSDGEIIKNHYPKHLRF